MKPARKLLTFKQFTNRQKQLSKKTPTISHTGIGNNHPVSDAPKEIHIGTQSMFEHQQN